MDWTTQILISVSGGGLFAAILTYLATVKVRKETTLLHWDQRNYQEKKDAYVGLLEALKHFLIDPTDVNLRQYAFNQALVELVGSPSVIIHSQQFQKSDPNSAVQKEAYQEMLNSMRMDLQVDIRAVGEAHN